MNHTNNRLFWTAGLVLTLLVTSSASRLAAQTYNFRSFEDLYDYLNEQKSEQQTEKQIKKAVSLTYDVDFQYYFDNREFDRVSPPLTESMTIHAVRATPSIGAKIISGKRMVHKVMFGIDASHNMGDNKPIVSGNGDDKTLTYNNRTNLELNLYYTLRAWLNNSEISGVAGIFPRSFSEGKYSTAFISDSLRFFDNNIEGLLIKVRRPRAYYEIGLDWMGQIGHNRRERFMVFSYGEGRVLPWMSLGWTFNSYHFANAWEYGGVVDNILAEPFIRFNFSRMTGIQDLSLKLGYMQSIQRDRNVMDSYDCPFGADIAFSVRNWNVGIENDFFIGHGMMPLYNNFDEGGHKYGSTLYYGSPFYRLHRLPDTDWRQRGMYNRTEIYYQPRISSWIDLRLSVVMHVSGDGEQGRFRTYLDGTQQKLSLIFCLDKMLHKTKLTY